MLSKNRLIQMGFSGNLHGVPDMLRADTIAAFALIEILVALSILALVCSSVLVVINRCMVSAAEITQKLNAFEVARENMEKILISDSVKESAEYGTSEKYPDIRWQTTVETFYPSDNQQMWVRAVCAAEYTDTGGETRRVEITDWLTDLTEEQSRKVLEAREAMEGMGILATMEEATEYAGVDEATIETWLKNGMVKDSSGNFLKSELDLYKQTGGNPTIADRIRQKEQERDADEGKAPEDDTEKSGEEQQPDGSEKRIGGRTYEELLREGFPKALLDTLFGGR